MKRHLITIKTLALLFCAVLISIVAVQCKKEGQNASSINRAMALSNVDSTIFSPFYDTTVLNIATVKATNDSIITTGIQSIIKANCGNCHNNNIKPNLVTFNDIKSLVTPGNPEASKLWEVINTNDLNKAMPPVTTAKIVSTEEKIAIYNWIKNGANETPALVDYRPAAVRLITGGCTAVCHNENVLVGGWARSQPFSFGRALSTTDTITSANVHRGPGCLAINDTLIARIWGLHQDSVRKCFVNPAVAAYKINTTPGSSSVPLTTYSDLLFEITYPTAGRKNTDIMDKMTGNWSIITRIDSTLGIVDLTGKYTKGNGSMAYGDGHLNSFEIAIIKGWFFADPNIPDQWKYGRTGQGLFKDKGGNMIIKK